MSGKKRRGVPGDAINDKKEERYIEVRLMTGKKSDTMR